MIGTECKVSWGTGRPLEALADLIEKRQKWFHESAEDAVIATAIDVLGSLRTRTRSAKNRRSTRPKVTRRTDLLAGYYGGRKNPHRTIRSTTGARVPAKRVKWLTAGVKNGDLKVFEVAPEHLGVKPYLVVARTQREAKKFENAAAVRRMAKYGNLAKWAFGVAMNKLSTRRVSENLTGEARHAGSRISFVGKRRSGDAFEVAVSDRLDYAAQALRGDMAAVDVACMKAANKIAGRLIHRFGDMLGPDFTTPFPEVRKER